MRTNSPAHMQAHITTTPRRIMSLLFLHGVRAEWRSRGVARGAYGQAGLQCKTSTHLRAPSGAVGRESGRPPLRLLLPLVIRTANRGTASDACCIRSSAQSPHAEQSPTGHQDTQRSLCMSRVPGVVPSRLSRTTAKASSAQHLWAVDAMRTDSHRHRCMSPIPLDRRRRLRITCAHRFGVRLRITSAIGCTTSVACEVLLTSAAHDRAALRCQLFYAPCHNTTMQYLVWYTTSLVLLLHMLAQW